MQLDLTYAGSRAMLTYRLPLNEVVFDFYDRLKSVSRGYASFDYHIDGYEDGELVKLSILVNHEPVDALGCIVHRTAAESRGRTLCTKLKDLIRRSCSRSPSRRRSAGRIVARETVRALRKDVLAKCYGGDISRKRKLLDKQKAGKKRMRQFGKVEIPQSALPGRAQPRLRGERARSARPPSTSEAVAQADLDFVGLQDRRAGPAPRQRRHR